MNCEDYIQINLSDNKSNINFIIQYKYQTFKIIFLDEDT